MVGSRGTAVFTSIALVLVLAAGVVRAQTYEQGVSDISLGRYAAWSVIANAGDEYSEHDLVKEVFADHIRKFHKNLHDGTPPKAWNLYFGAGLTGDDPNSIPHFYDDIPIDPDIWPEAQNWVFKEFAVVRQSTRTAGGTSSAQNYLGQGYTYTVAVNDLSPGTRIQTKYDMFYVENDNHGFGHIAYPSQGGSVVSADFAVPGSSTNIDGSALEENWVLLFDSQTYGAYPAHVPVLVSFSHRPSNISCDPDNIIFSFANKLTEEEMTLFISLPYGVDVRDAATTAGWIQQGLNQNDIDHFRLINRMVNNWPVAVDETFAFEPAGNAPPRVVIRNEFSYDYIGQNWGVPQTPYAVIPPVLGLAYDEGLDISIPSRYMTGVVAEKIADFPTKYGPLYMIDNHSYSEYELPGAPDHDVHLIGSNKETVWKQRLNRMLNHTVVQNQIHAEGVWNNIGNTGQTASLAMTTDETRDHYLSWMSRIACEVVLDVGGSQVGTYYGWQEWDWEDIGLPPDGEWPRFWAYMFNGADYYPYVVRPYDIDAQMGTALEFLYEYGLWSGEWSQLDSYWSGGQLNIPDIFEPLQLFHDWAFMAGFHDVFGGEGCHMDMFSAQLAGYDAYGKIAAALGHETEARRARYLAAKAQIPFVTRWVAKDYVSNYYKTVDGQIIKGFGEYEPSDFLNGNLIRTTQEWADWTVSGERIHLLGYDVLRTVLDASIVGEDPFLEALLDFKSEPGLFNNGEYSPVSFPENKLYGFFRYRDLLNMGQAELINWIDNIFIDRVKPDDAGELQAPRFEYSKAYVDDWSSEDIIPRIVPAGDPRKGSAFPLIPAIAEAYGVPVRIGTWAPLKLVSAMYDPDLQKCITHFELGSPAASSPNALIHFQVDAQPGNVSVSGGHGPVDYDPMWQVVKVPLRGSGPWDVEISLPPGSGAAWEVVPPDNNLVADGAFENSGPKPNYEMAWYPWSHYNTPATTNLVKYEDPGILPDGQSARFVMEGPLQEAGLYQNIWIGEKDQLLDISFKYRFTSDEMWLNAGLYQGPDDFGVHPSLKLYYEHISPGTTNNWEDFTWSGPVKPEYSTARPLFYVVNNPNKGWESPTHEVYIDSITVTNRSLPQCQIGPVSVTTEFNEQYYTWTAELTFDSDLPMVPAVLYSPNTDCKPYPNMPELYQAGTEGTHHVIQLANLGPSAQYHYSIIGSEIDQPEGNFQLTVGPSAIYDVSHSFNEVECQIQVQWKTRFESTHNTLWFKKSNYIIWSSRVDSLGNCDEDRSYFMSFPVAENQDYDIKISTDINGTTYWSDVMTEHAARCEEPPNPDLTTTAEELKQPFLRMYPNPFNPTTTLIYNAPSATDVSLKIYNVDGRLVKTLVSGTVTRGVHTIEWDARNNAGNTMASGIYFVKLRIADEVLTSKLVLLK